MIERVRDPVCRMEIRLDQAVEAAFFEGQRVYFCSATCHAAFLDTPHRYRGWEIDRARAHTARLHVPGRSAVTVGASGR